MQGIQSITGYRVQGIQSVTEYSVQGIQSITGFRVQGIQSITGFSWCMGYRIYIYNRVYGAGDTEYT